MDILIKSAGGAVDVVEKNPGVYHVLSLRDVPELRDDCAKPPAAPVDKVKKLTKSIKVFRFDDVEHAHEGTPVTRDQIREILAWSADKERILIHCNAGVGRSSAVAFLIACQTQKPEEAVKMLNPNIHYPNLVVLKLGAEVMENPRILEVGLEFRKKSVDMAFRQYGGAS